MKDPTAEALHDEQPDIDGQRPPQRAALGVARLVGLMGKRMTAGTRVGHAATVPKARHRRFNEVTRARDRGIYAAMRNSRI